MTRKPASALREAALCDMGSALIVSAYENHKTHARFQESQRSWAMAGFIAFSSGLLTIVASQNYVAMGDETRMLPDGWTVVTADGSLSAHAEHTVAVTEAGHEILTARG